MAPIGNTRPKALGLKRSVNGYTSKYKKPRKMLTRKDVIYIARGLMETKQKIFVDLSYTYSNNTPACWNLTYAIGQGNTGYNRIGDKISLTGFKFKAEANIATVAQTDFRVMLLWSNVQSATQTALTSNNIFLDGSANPGTSALVDTRKVSVLFDKVFRLQDNWSGQAYGAILDFYKKINTDFVYAADSSLYGESVNLFLVLIPHQIATFGQPYFNWNGILYFKDA